MAVPSNSTLHRRIAHLDMDAFFASVELQRYPELKGLPVVIGGRDGHPERGRDGQRTFARLGDYTGRGVVTTATYEARVFGIGSAMPMMRAAALAPQALRLPVDGALYRDYSRRFKAAVAHIAPCIEDRGVDEIYIDLSAHAEDTWVLARRIKQAVHDATGLSCSIGIAANKLLAKIASELDKPDGITVLLPEHIPTRIWPLPVSKINGVGARANERLASLGLHTIGELAQASLTLLQRQFGRGQAQWLLSAAQGLDDRPVVTRSEPRSLSRETTFERDLHVVYDRAELSRSFQLLCHRVADDLARKGYGGRTVGIKLRFEDFQTVTRDLTVDRLVTSGPLLHSLARQCLRRVVFNRRIRLLGVRVSKLHKLDAPDDSVLDGQLPLGV